MATTNKEELIKTVTLLQEENIKLKEQLKEFDFIKKEFESNKKLKDDVILSEYALKKEKDKLLLLIEDNKKAHHKAEEDLKKEITRLKTELDKLAGLFNEYIVSFKEQIQMFDLFQKNAKTVEKYLLGKVDAFNKGETKEGV